MNPDAVLDEQIEQTAAKLDTLVAEKAARDKARKETEEHERLKKQQDNLRQLINYVAESDEEGDLDQITLSLIEELIITYTSAYRTDVQNTAALISQINQTATELINIADTISTNIIRGSILA